MCICYQTPPSSSCMQLQKPLYNPIFSRKNNEAQTPKTCCCYAAKLRGQQQNKACSTASFPLDFTLQPACKEKENVNKRGQKDRKSTNLQRSSGCGREREAEGGRGREGCCSLLVLFTSPKRNPWNTADLCPEPRLGWLSHAVNLPLQLYPSYRGHRGSLRVF